MRTVTFQSVLHFVAHKLGLNPASDSGGNFTNDVAAALTAYINFHLREAWERDFWPELLAIEERSALHRDAWALATPYATNEEVSYATAVESVGYGLVTGPAGNTCTLERLSTQPAVAAGMLLVIDGIRYTVAHFSEGGGPPNGGYEYPGVVTIVETFPENFLDNVAARITSTRPAFYRALAPSTGSQPGLDAELWEEFTPADRFVPYETEGATPLGTVRAVWKYNRRYREMPPRYDFWTHPLGIVIDNVAPPTVFVEFRRRPHVFTSTAYDVATDYATGARVYDAVTGECYLAIANPPTGTVPTNTAYWQKIDFPAVLAGYVQKRAYAEALEEDGQHEKAAAQIDAAEELLAIEWGKAEGQQAQHRTFHVFTRIAPHC